MFEPSSDDAGTLLSNLRSTFIKFQSEAIRELGHLERLITDTATTLRNRKATDALVSGIDSAHTAVTYAMGRMSDDIRDAEESLQALHNYVGNLEPTW